MICALLWALNIWQFKIINFNPCEAQIKLIELMVKRELKWLIS
jgi:hypothetical protein